MGKSLKQLFVIAFSAVAVYATAQSFNIDIGNTAPSSTYGGAGLAGFWNVTSVTSVQTPVALNGLDGGAGTGVTLDFNSSSTAYGGLGNYTGDDRNLMADWGIGSITFNFANLLNGNYNVILYASTYSSSGGNSSGTRFTLGGNSILTTGGAWTGAHVEGQSFVKYSNVSVTDGTLSFLSESASSLLDGIAGFQLEYTSASPVPEPVTMTLMGLGAIAAWRKRRAKQA